MSVSLVLLSWDDMMCAAHAGIMRTCQQKAEGARDALKSGGQINWNIDVYGAAAEMAVAKLMGRYWSRPIGYDRDAADVGESVEVKFTRHVTGGLAVPKKDAHKAEHSFVCVRCGPPEAAGVLLDVVGWLPGIQAMQPQFWQEQWQEPGWLVPAQLLRPMPEKAA